MPTISVLRPRNGGSVGLLDPSMVIPLPCAGPSPQVAQERHSSRWPAHPQACKCLCPSRYSGRARMAPFAVANQARARPQLPVLAGATWSCAWLLPYTGSVPRPRPSQFQDRAVGNRAWEERFPSTPPCFVRVLGNMASRLQARRTLRDIASLGLHSFTGLQVAFEGVG